MNQQADNYVAIYSDGACSGNPGVGGFGVVLLHNRKRLELSKGFRKTTNNRMELMAVIQGLSCLKKRCHVTVYTDSQYIVNSITMGWAKKWQANGWKRNSKERALNSDLWQELLSLCEEHDVEFKWIKGHHGNKENEVCDRLATQAASGTDLDIDSVYEASNQ
ncbi:MAG: ribonuclease HI [Chloroflexota bacterium]|nr:ribonuclease HI [Chloroflexota bacterium]